MKDRRCTDILFTILFLAFVGVYGWVCNQGFTNGDPERLLSPVDFDGKLCGVDYPEHPFLYFLINVDQKTIVTGNVDIEYKAICVSECPATNTTEPIDCKLITELTEASCASRINMTNY